MVCVKAYLGPCQTAMMNFFSQHYWQLTDVSYFGKKVPSKIFGRVLNETKYSRTDQVKFVEDSF